MREKDHRKKYNTDIRISIYRFIVILGISEERNQRKVGEKFPNETQREKKI